MTNQDLPDDLQPGDKIGDVVLKDSDFDGATLRTRDVWKFLYERSNYQLVRSPRTVSPPDRGQSTMNISSRDTRPRDLEKDFSASSEEEGEEEEDDEEEDEDADKEVQISDDEMQIRRVRSITR